MAARGGTVDKNLLVKRPNPLFNNCEHFTDHISEDQLLAGGPGMVLLMTVNATHPQSAEGPVVNGKQRDTRGLYRTAGQSGPAGVLCCCTGCGWASTLAVLVQVSTHFSSLQVRSRSKHCLTYPPP
jgi:hypothetical protein